MNLKQIKSKVTATAFLTVTQLGRIRDFCKEEGITSESFYSLIECCQKNNRELFDEINAIKEVEPKCQS